MKVGDKILITEEGMKNWFFNKKIKPAYGFLVYVERCKLAKEYEEDEEYVDEDNEETWVTENIFDLYDSLGQLVYKSWYLEEGEFILISKREPEEWM